MSKRRLTSACWSMIDKGAIANLRKQGWRVKRLKDPPIIDFVPMKLEARKGPWRVIAPDACRLWDVCQPLNTASPGQGAHRRYLVGQEKRRP